MARQQIGSSLPIVLLLILLMGMVSVTGWQMLHLESKVTAYSLEHQQLFNFAQDSLSQLEQQIAQIEPLHLTCKSESACDAEQVIEPSYTLAVERLTLLASVQENDMEITQKGYWQYLPYSATDVVYQKLLKGRTTVYIEVTAGAETEDGQRIYLRSTLGKTYSQ